MRAALALALAGAAAAAPAVLSGVRLPGARCLDGSPYMYYISVGSSAAKFLISHQGGGWCQTTDECVQRANTSLGSSTTWAATSTQGDIMDRNPAVNPLMADWTFVYLPYCGE
jgi:hypothetical protein